MWGRPLNRPNAGGVAGYRLPGDSRAVNSQAQDKHRGQSGPAAGWADEAVVENVNVTSAQALASPRQVKAAQPIPVGGIRQVLEARDTIRRILAGTDDRLLVVVGPCSIHDEPAALEYARRLRDLSQKVCDRLYLVMRVYFEKPRTIVGWKGLINDPHLDGSFDMETGIRTARRILLAVTGMGLATGTEMLDPITPQYIADLVAWAAIGARTIESQTHRQMASGLSMPIGYKNSTAGDLGLAIDAMKSARAPHSFLGIDEDGRTAIIKTRGNPLGHLILRGGKHGPNYDAHSVAQALEVLSAAKLPAAVMVDCSHANSEKKFRNEEKVWKDVIHQRRAARRPGLMGLLLESNLLEGNQPLPNPPVGLKYGVSITDECLGWDKTEELILWAHAQLRRP